MAIKSIFNKTENLVEFFNSKDENFSCKSFLNYRNKCNYKCLYISIVSHFIINIFLKIRNDEWFVEKINENNKVLLNFTYPTIPWEIFLASKESSSPRPLMWEWAPILSILVTSFTSETFGAFTCVFYIFKFEANLFFCLRFDSIF